MYRPLFTFSAVVPLLFAAGSAMAQQRANIFSFSWGTASSFITTSPTVSSWMSPEVGSAWSKGYMGQGTTVHVLDQFNTTPDYVGNLTGTAESQTHGYWVRKEANMIAPLAKSVAVDNMSNTPLVLNRGLNVANLSYQVFGAAGLGAAQFGFDRLDSSVIEHAKRGTAVVVKAAGNYAIPVNAPNWAGNVDYLNLAFRDTKSAIYVGALSTNGSVTQPARLEVYSNTPGPDAEAQKRFLVVGINSGQTGLYGTSFAAPIVSAYAAILGSKFGRATPVQISNQLLTTARKDTISGYNVAVHGQGEASLTRALAPANIK